MNKVQTYKQIVSEAYNLSSPLLLDTALQQVSKEKDELLKELNNSGSVKVPVVGDFSAGKSSLLNAFIGRELLTVDITPETAVAYELYYSLDEHVELYRDFQKIEERPINEIKHITTRPGDIAKVYVNSLKIKQLEVRGITLVDMPGTDSGIKEHNDAILNYINKGTVFVICVDCAGGSLRQSTIEFISELAKYNLKPAVLVTKIDKKPVDEVKEVVEYIGFQSKRAVSSEIYVGQVSAHGNDIEAFENFLDSLDVNNLISEKFGARIGLYLNTHLSALEAQSKIFQTEIENVDEKIATLENEKKVASDAINDSRVGDTPEKSTQDVLDIVTSTLRTHSEEIAQMVIARESATEINARILSYIRPAIVLAFREEGEQYASSLKTVVDNVTIALQDNIRLDGNIFDNLIDSLRSEINGAITVVAEILMNTPNIFTKALGWLLMVLGDKLPDLVKWVFGKSKDDMLREVIDRIESSFFPQIIESLRPEILNQITAQQKRIRENINENISASIGNMQDSIMVSREMANKKEKEVAIVQINDTIVAIKSLKSKL